MGTAVMDSSSLLQITVRISFQGIMAHKHIYTQITYTKNDNNMFTTSSSMTTSSNNKHNNNNKKEPIKRKKHR